MSDETAIAGRVAVFCCSSAGELDVMLPLLYSNGISDFRFFTFKAQISKKIDEDGLYRRLISGRMEDKTIDRLAAGKLGRLWQFVKNSFSTLRQCWGYDRFCFEYGNAGREKNILVAMLLASGRGGQILFYPHGHAVTAESAYMPKRWPSITRLAVRGGARIIKLDGVARDARFVSARYPIMRSSWRQVVREHVRPLYTNHVVILSRDSHPDYLPPGHREQMLRDVVRVFSKFYPGARLVLKAHPREVFDSDRIMVEGHAVDITYESTYSVVCGARLAVSFWTSAFFQCLVQDVPVVEYHLPHDRFRMLYPEGSLNKEFVPTFNDIEGLSTYVEALAKFDVRAS